MAKKSRSKASTGLPKTVAGMKVPKALRKSGPLGALLTSGLTREILADVIIAAAGAAAAVLTRSRPASAAADEQNTPNTAAGAVAGVVTDTARSLLPASLLGEDETPRYDSRSSRTDSRKRARDPQKAARPKRKRKTKAS